MRVTIAILLIFVGIILLAVGTTVPNLDMVQVSCSAIGGIMLAGLGLARLID